MLVLVDFDNVDLDDNFVDLYLYVRFEFVDVVVDFFYLFLLIHFLFVQQYLIHFQFLLVFCSEMYPLIFQFLLELIGCFN